MYPTRFYHPIFAPQGKTFTDDAEVAALGEDWVDTPTKFPPTPLTDNQPAALTEAPVVPPPTAPPAWTTVRRRSTKEGA